MNRHLLAAALLGIVPLVSAHAYDVLGEGSHPCPEGHLPAVCCFDPQRDGFTLTLCGSYSSQWDAVENDQGDVQSRERDRPRVELSGGAWRWLEPVAPSATCRTPQPGGASDTASSPDTATPSLAPGCPAALAAAMPVLTPEQASRLRPQAGRAGAGKQEVGACVEQGGYVWFGVAFYDGEGASGVGGIGRFDPRTNAVEIRRPAPLLRWSSAALAHDGRWLWLTTYRYGEGGDEPAIGVVRYGWDKDKLLLEPDAMCGFLARGMAVVGKDLWLASDGGLSRRDAQGRWEHYVFEVGQPRALRKVTCAQVYDVARTTVAESERAKFIQDLAVYTGRRRRARDK